MEELKEGIIINNRYLLKKFKGSGSFGEVWLAKDNLLGIDVALKIYIALDDHGLEEFRSEYLATQGLSHPNLLKPLHFDIWGKKPFLVMDYCPNGSIANKAGRMEEKEIWQFIYDVASGLNYLHNLPEPIIHQDIKPDNVLINQSGTCQITDFGISKRVRTTLLKQTQKKNEGAASGAVAYMGPEKYEQPGSPIKASDIWALGVSIFELATGELPFSGMGGQVQLQYPSIPQIQGKSRDLNKLLEVCLAKNTWDRFTAAQIQEVAKKKIEGKRIKWSGEEEIKTSQSNRNKSSISKIRKITKPLYKSYKNNALLWILGILVVCGFCAWWIIWSYKYGNATQDAPEVNIPISVSNVQTDNNSIGAEQTQQEVLTPIQEKKVESKVNRQQPLESTISVSSATGTGNYNFGYATYTGEMRNGKPEGEGKMTFIKSHSDGNKGYNAEAGDYIVGEFANGILQPGAKLYDNSGNLKQKL